MSNHVHYVAVPLNDDSLAKTFNALHMMYSRSFNQKGGGNGHLWQGRFFSCVLDEPHVYAAVRYVENNPVRAKMADKAEDYRWSSAGAHVCEKPDFVLSDDCYLTERITDWRRYLNEKENTAMSDTLFQNTKTGRPCGDEAFISHIESLVGRKLTALPAGRPKKTK